MLRFLRMALGLVLILSATGRDARAQWGYGGWGWGGWGGGGATPGSAALQGAGSYLMGAGSYNLNTAQARSINAQTAIMYNDYVAQVTHESARIHAARVHQEFARNQALYDAHQKRLRENPGRVEIENGDALNVAAEDLSDPRLGSSALRAANIPVSASLIGEIPFVYASERVTFMLDDIRSSVRWPDVFKEERFANAKQVFDDLAKRLRAQAAEGEISPRLLRDAKGFVSELRGKLEAKPLTDPLDQKEAMEFVTACDSLLNLLEKPNIQPALLELRKVKDTTIGSLLGFMHAYNLRFGAANTVKERQAFFRLFEILDETRDQILGEAKLDRTTAIRTHPKAATNFFQTLGPQNRPQGGPPPQPPQPQNPQ